MPDPTTPSTSPTGSTGGLDLSGLAQLIPGIADLINGLNGQGNNQGATAASMADPYNKYRGQAADQLNTLVNDPSSVTSTPGYQFGLNQALDAGNRSSAAQGQGNSGNNIVGQADIGERYATNAYNTEFSQLSSLALGNPSDASKDYLVGNALNTSDTSSGIGSIASFFSSPSGQSLIKSLGSSAPQLLKMIEGSGDMSPDAIAQLNQTFGVGGGLGTTNDAGVTPGGTSGLFGPSPVDNTIPPITDTTPGSFNFGVTPPDITDPTWDIGDLGP